MTRHLILYPLDEFRMVCSLKGWNSVPHKADLILLMYHEMQVSRLLYVRLLYVRLCIHFFVILAQYIHVMPQCCIIPSRQYLLLKIS
jgi:hypothetical protein